MSSGRSYRQALMTLAVAGLPYRPCWAEGVYITRQFGKLVKIGPGLHDSEPYTPTRADEAARDWEVL